MRTVVRRVVPTEIFQSRWNKARWNKARWNKADFDFSVEDFSVENGSAGSATGGKKFVNATGLASGSTTGLAQGFTTGLAPGSTTGLASGFTTGLASGFTTVSQNMAIGKSAKERIKASAQHSPTRVHISATNQIYLVPGASRGRHKLLVDRIIITNEPLRR